LILFAYTSLFSKVIHLYILLYICCRNNYQCFVKLC